MKMVLTYLEMLNSLKTQLAEASAKLKEDMEAQNKLSKNPNNVVETETYKDISNGEILMKIKLKFYTGLPLCITTADT